MLEWGEEEKRPPLSNHTERIICDAFESESSMWNEWVAKKIKFKHKRIARRFAEEKLSPGTKGEIFTLICNHRFMPSSGEIFEFYPFTIKIAVEKRVVLFNSPSHTSKRT